MKQEFVLIKSDSYCLGRNPFFCLDFVDSYFNYQLTEFPDFIKVSIDDTKPEINEKEWSKALIERKSAISCFEFSIFVTFYEGNVAGNYVTSSFYSHMVMKMNRMLKTDKQKLIYLKIEESID